MRLSVVIGPLNVKLFRRNPGILLSQATVRTEEITFYANWQFMGGIRAMIELSGPIYTAVAPVKLMPFLCPYMPGKSVFDQNLTTLVAWQSQE